MTQDYQPPGDDDQPHYDDTIVPIRRAHEPRGTGVTMYDHTIERALVASVFIKPDCYTQAVNAGVTPAAFTDATMGLIWQTFDRLADDNQPLDPVTVAARARAEHLAVPDAAKLHELGTNEGFKTSNADTYATQLVEYQTTRHFYDRALALSNGKFVNLRAELDDIAAEWDQKKNTGTQSRWVDLRSVYENGGLIGRPPTVMARSDGALGLFYRGQINSVFGESESCKSWLAQQACAELLALGEHVVYYDFEKDAAQVMERLLGMNVEPEVLFERFHYDRPEAAFTAADLGAMRVEAATMQPAVVVFDGVTNAMQLAGRNLLDNRDIAAWYESAPQLYKNADAAVITVDHDTKNHKEVKLPGQIGGQHKRAGITGASYKMVLTKKPARAAGEQPARDGRGFLKVDKDAPGHVRGHCPDGESIGDVVLTPTASGGLIVTVEPPAAPPITKSAEGVTRRTGYMARACKVVKDAGARGMSNAEVRTELNAAANYVLDALKCLASEGFINHNGKTGSASRYFYVRAFLEDPLFGPGFFGLE